ncbi:MAG TPA: pseudouridine synthase [Anaerolineales bacterium]|nr:pseudouridine synthase [Anaerolineales bacterium]
MAQAGHGSRRACEQIIREGRVTVNNQRAEIGLRADPQTDVILVDGHRLNPAQPLSYILFHKPVGVLCSTRSQGGWPTVTELVDSPVRLYPVGRLDLDSEGLVLLTNDGELANRLTHPSWGHEKEYRVLLDQVPSEDLLRRWCEGVTLADARRTGPARAWMEADSGNGPWLRVVLTQGMKRQIRETAEVLGLKVKRLIRIRMGTLGLGDLSPGTWRDLTDREMILLRSANER